MTKKKIFIIASLSVSSSFVIGAVGGLGIVLLTRKTTKEKLNKQLNLNPYISGVDGIILKDPNHQQFIFTGNWDDTNSDIWVDGMDQLPGLSFNKTTKVLDVSHLNPDNILTEDGEHKFITIHVHRRTDNTYCEREVYFYNLPESDEEHTYPSFSDLPANEAYCINTNDDVVLLKWDLKTGEIEEQTPVPTNVYSIQCGSNVPENWNPDEEYYLPTIVASKTLASVILPHNDVKWKISNSFLAGCSSLEFVEPSSPLKNGSYDIDKYCKITSIIDGKPVLNPYPELEYGSKKYYYGVLSNTTSLHAIDSKIFKNIKYIPDYFFFSSTVYDFDFSNLPEILWIGDKFFSQTFLIDDFEFEYSPKLRYIGNDFFSKSYIQTATFNNISLYSVGDNFLSDCKKLTSVVLPKFTSDYSLNISSSVGDNFLANDTALSKISSSSSSSYFDNINYFGNNMCANCPSLQIINPSFANFQGNTHSLVENVTSTNGMYLSRTVKYKPETKENEPTKAYLEVNKASFPILTSLSDVIKDYLSVPIVYNSYTSTISFTPQPLWFDKATNDTADGSYTIYNKVDPVTSARSLLFEFTLPHTPNENIYSQRIGQNNAEGVFVPISISTFRGPMNFNLIVNFVNETVLTKEQKDNFDFNANFNSCILGTSSRQVKIPSTLIPALNSSITQVIVPDKIQADFKYESGLYYIDVNFLEQYQGTQNWTYCIPVKYKRTTEDTEKTINLYFSVFSPTISNSGYGELPFNFFENTNAYQINLSGVANWKKFKQPTNQSQHKPFYNASCLSILCIDLERDYELGIATSASEGPSDSEELTFKYAYNVNNYCVLTNLNKTDDEVQKEKIKTALIKFRKFFESTIGNWEVELNYEY